MEKNYKWTFAPKGELDMGQGSEDASFPQFEKYALRNLIREYTQNSLDAHDEKSSDPVKIKVSTLSLNIDNFPNLTKELLPHLEAASKSCEKNNNGRNPYPPKINALKDWIKSGELPTLVFSDFNTTGMPYMDEFKTGVNSGFNACVRQSCASYKPENSSGGSHGLGKTVGFVNSAINAVIYSTLTIKGDAFCEGVVKLCDHNIESQRFKAHGFYDSENGVHPGKGEDIPEELQRSDPGTDAIVLGIAISEDEKIEMKKNLLRGFFMAIWQGKLTADLFEEEFTQSNLLDKIYHYFNTEDDVFDSIRQRDVSVHFSPRPYLTEAVAKAGEDDDHLKYKTSDVTPEKWDNFSATFYLWKSDELKSKSRDTIIYMRDKLMTIEVSRKREHRGYKCVVVVNKGSSELRKIEDVTHDHWDNAELRRLSKEDKETIKSVQNQLKDFVETCINLAFPDNENEERSLQSLSSFDINLAGGAKPKSTEEDAVWPTSNELDEIKSVNKGSRGGMMILETGRSKKKKRKGQTSKTKRGRRVVTTESDDPVDPPTPTPPTPPRPKPPIEKFSGRIEKDEFESENGNHNSEVGNNEVKHLRELKLLPSAFKLIPLSDSEFTSKLIIRSPKDCVGCSLALYISTLGGGNVPLELEKVEAGLYICGENNNEIRGFNLYKDQANIIYFTPVNKSINYSLSPNAYETR
ncbi:MAG: hypothetical protein K2K45_03170 [Muribaculaceae bacterium]|nr:hypothetical protein [Muribaculaceae bacterium]